MSINNINKIETAKEENEELLKNNIDKFKTEESSYIDIRFSVINPYKSPSSYDQPSAGFIKWTLTKSPYFHSLASKFTKHISFMTLEGDTLLKLQKWWDSIIYSF